MRDAGYTKTDAFSPFPLHEIDEALGSSAAFAVAGFRRRVDRFDTGFALQIFVHYVDYPLMSAVARLSASVVYTASLRLTILFAGFAAVFGMLFLNGLPQPYHPVFNVPRLLWHHGKFFLLIEKRPQI